MRARYWYCLALLSAAACGRVGVHGLPLDAALTPQHMDAGALRDAGQSAVDSGVRRDAAAGGRSGSLAPRGGTAAEAGPYRGPDAAMPMPMDAGPQPPPLDAGADAASERDAGDRMTCGGESVFGLCWYLAAQDTSCNQECANKGGFDTRAPSYVGIPSQGGSEAECEQIFRALGRSGSVGPATQTIGLGCHVWNDGTLYWLQSPAFSPNVATPLGTRARIVCACSR